MRPDYSTIFDIPQTHIEYECLEWIRQTQNRFLECWQNSDEPSRSTRDFETENIILKQHFSLQKRRVPSIRQAKAERLEPDQERPISEKAIVRRPYVDEYEHAR